jgi:Domain of unknown function (DUF6894)
MSRYYFNLKLPGETLLDPEGTDLPDEEAALDHARRVVRELMHNAQVRTRLWRLAVSDEDRLPCFELLFAAFDDSLLHLIPELRSSVEMVRSRHASLIDAIVDMRMTMLQVKGTLARANGTPYIAAGGGRPLIV